MATGIAGAAMAGPTGLIATNPLGAFAILATTGLIDSQVIMPALNGKGRQAAKPAEVLGVAADANAAGAPRCIAYGRRVRVPTHILWQDQKVRETNASTNAKSGQPATLVRRVYFDALVAVNDRPTVSLSQLIGNGQLILFDTLNLVDIATTGMAVSVSGGRVILTMVDNDEPDFADRFAVGDVVKLSGFINTAGHTLNYYDNSTGFANYWKVAVVTGHTASGGSIELDPYFGQTVAAIAATAGTAAAPAKITRVDDVMFATTVEVTDPNTFQHYYKFTSDSHVDPSDLFANAEGLRIANCVAPYANANGTYVQANGLTATTLRVLLTNLSAPLGAGTPNASGTPVIISRVATYAFTAGYFPPTFVPSNHFFNGSETQDPSPLLTAVEGADVPAFRGIAYQGLDDYFATNTGDQLPFALEAVIEPDASMTWAQVVALLLERSGIQSGEIDTTGIDDKPFGGFFVRGSVPTVTAIQPLLIAGGLLGQERDGKIAMFSLPNADVVQIAHGADFSDFGVRMDGEAPEELWSTEDAAQEDLPTSVGVRFQDFDNGLADGYQHFGLRHPSGVDWQNEQEIDVSNLVLTRKEARNLASTVLRRAHVNRRTYRFTLGARYIDLCENDLVTWTDDEGEDHTARVISRDIGADFRVVITAVAEDVDVAVVGSPVQSTAGSSSSTPATGQVGFDVLDIPAIDNAETSTPGIKVAAWPVPGSTWAGSSVWVSIDGTTWTNRGIISAPAAVGTFDGDMASEPAAESYGTTTVSLATGAVDVTFDSVGTGIESVTQAEAEAGANWCALIASDGTVEIAAFLDASLVTGTTYTLSNWLRGLRGTSVGDRLEGTRIVILRNTQDAGVLHLDFPGSVYPQSIGVKCVPPGRSTDDVVQQNVVTTWRNVLPLPVRSISKTIGASPFDARFTINYHWNRELQRIGTQPPHPLDEPREGYRLTIYDPAGLIVKRIMTKQVQPTTGSPALRDKWFDYTAAQQTADGYTPSGAETFVIDIQQIGHFGIGPSIKQEL